MVLEELINEKVGYERSILQDLDNSIVKRKTPPTPEFFYKATKRILKVFPKGINQKHPKEYRNARNAINAITRHILTENIPKEHREMGQVLKSILKNPGDKEAWNKFISEKGADEAENARQAYHKYLRDFALKLRAQNKATKASVRKKSRAGFLESTSDHVNNALAAVVGAVEILKY